MRDILAGVPPASFQTHAHMSYKLLVLLFSSSWQKVPRERPDMHGFLLQLEVIEASMYFHTDPPLSILQPRHYRDEIRPSGISSTSSGISRHLVTGFPIPLTHSAPQLVDHDEHAATGTESLR
jgi:hypothetical protein